MKECEGSDLNYGELNFTYQRKQRKVTSDDENIWVYDSGVLREGPHEYVLHFNGKIIGFSAPDKYSSSDYRDYEGQTVWVIDRVGQSVNRYIDSKLVVIAPDYKFISCDEQKDVIAIIKFAMTKKVIRLGDEAKVVFSTSLEAKINSGELINQSKS